MVLDEVATTQRIADEGLWLPVLKPMREPWLDLELVVDESISMQIWRRTIRELERLLKNYGIFRDVRVWGLISDESEDKEEVKLNKHSKNSVIATKGKSSQIPNSISPQIQIRRGLGATAKNQFPRSPKELIDPTNRRLVLVVSDCVSSFWGKDEIRKTLELWSNHLPLAIVQMLPQWLWERTALGRESEVRLQGLFAGIANQYLIHKEVSLWDELEEENPIKVPIFTLESTRVATWAQMLSGKGNIWTLGYVFERDISQRKAGVFKSSSGEITAEQRVQRFRVTASPMARKLACLLSASPVISFPVVRLIQETMLKESLQVNVAEVFLGGLLKPLSEINAQTNPDYVLYEFWDGVRNLLIDSVPSNYVLTILEQVSEYVAKKSGLSLEEFTAVLKQEKVVDDSEVIENINYFATVTAQVLRRLGGEYAKFADSIDNEIAVGNITHPVEENINYAFQCGGALSDKSPSYVQREADYELFNKLKNGDFCYVLNSPKMGKSSLVFSVKARLEKEGFFCVYIDLSGIGQANEIQWYSSVATRLVREFRPYVNIKFRQWREENDFLSPVEQLNQLIDSILLPAVPKDKKIIIFLDEIDYVRSLNFNCDQFFILIRSFYNQRSKNKDYNRLNFCLIGVATPSDLIEDKQITPFNIGSAITLKGFMIEEVEPLIKGFNHLVNDPKKVMEEILYWTGGQPFLTQRLCYLVVNQKQQNPDLTEIVQRNIIDNWDDPEQDQEEHLKTIENRILRDERRAILLLELYRNILQEGRGTVTNTKGKKELQLSGLVVKKGNILQVYNPIYAKIFDETWIDTELNKLRPYSENYRAWLQSGKTDESRLLRGQALIEAEKWASGKNLGEEDRDFLGESRAKQREHEIGIKLLLLSVNPKDTTLLRVDEEMREIREGLRRSKQRENFVIDTAVAGRYRDIRRAILDHEPNIVHFSGYGEGEEGLVFEDETGHSKFVEAEALARLFELFADSIQCVVLHACYFEVQAKAITKHIPYVIGMNKAIGDEAAIAFAIGFYDALGAGRTVEFAYKVGCNSMEIAGIPEHLTPQLLSNPDVIASQSSSERDIADPSKQGATIYGFASGSTGSNIVSGQTVQDNTIIGTQNNYGVSSSPPASEIEALQGESEPNQETIKLRSKKDINYTKLQELLKQENFPEADQETQEVMYKVIKGLKPSEQLKKTRKIVVVTAKEIDNFPCEDLLIIDKLWLEYSNGRYGFSVQSRIYIDDLGATKEFSNEIWDKFCERVGWSEGGSFKFNDRQTTRPTGYFPFERKQYFPCDQDWKYGGWLPMFLHRVKTCNW